MTSEKMCGNFLTTLSNCVISLICLSLNTASICLEFCCHANLMMKLVTPYNDHKRRTRRDLNRREFSKNEFFIFLFASTTVFVFIFPTFILRLSVGIHMSIKPFKQFGVTQLMIEVKKNAERATNDTSLDKLQF